MLNDGYFSDLSLLDWVGVVLLAPLLLALTILIVYLIIGMIISGPRLRRIAREKQTPKPTDEIKPTTSPRRAPGD